MKRKLFFIVLFATICKANSQNIPEPKMVFVQGGKFEMGSNSRFENERPSHHVTVSSFYIASHEVTQSQWKSVMGNSPSWNSGCDNCPVERVSWKEVQDFIRKLNSKTGKKYRLPIEAEWEYAAKGGARTQGFDYCGGKGLFDVGWYDLNSGGKTHSVGSKQPNELGLFDMSGNVWELCEDYFDFYSMDEQTNPRKVKYNAGFLKVQL